ncbi:MAG: hypothetical protein FWG04_05505 [Desulfovibrionaceae bacterium]|nr:hypothetical protein [Desulfovibrionaceae bacterium]
MSGNGPVHVLQSIPFCPDPAQCRRILRVEGNVRREKELADLLEQAASKARPKVVWRACVPEFLGSGRTALNGHCFSSKVLAKLLRGAVKDAGSPVVFPFIATCGEELGHWASAVTGKLRAYWAHTLTRLALKTALDRLEAELKPFGRGVLSRVEPGIPKDWPVTEQPGLFALLAHDDGPVAQLNEYCVMRPLSSISGLYFFSKKAVPPCTYCVLPTCRGKHAPKSRPEPLFCLAGKSGEA